MTEIVIASPGQADDTAFVEEVAALVNQVYAEGEKGIWVEGTTRTDAAEIAAMIRAGGLAVARDGDLLLGVARVQLLPTGEGEFGMLAAQPAHQGTGLGRRLVDFAESWARERGVRIMQLEVLFPNEWEHPMKVFLRDWYVRRGYRVVCKGDFALDYPALAPRLATPCDYLIFNRELAPLGAEGRIG